MSMPTLPEPAEPVVENPGFRDLDPNGVIEQPFWERYNTRLEMPVSVAIAAIMFLVAIAALVYLARPQTSDKISPPMHFLGGEDDAGDGSPDGGGADLASGKQVSAADLAKPLNDVQLNDVKKEIREKLDLGGDIEIPDSQAEILGRLNDDIRNKLLGAKPGTGGKTGGNANGGTGPGGAGASSTYARGLRWIMKFETTTGQDYINQISGIGGVILVPVPPERKVLILFKNLRNPQGAPATDADINTYANLIRFGEGNRDTVQSVGEALKLNFKPAEFYVYFPAELEEKLASLERNYGNKTPEQIRSTTFKVVIRGGSYDFIVTDQKTR
ncbi:hypothetical protein [Limnoglobus roseus]|uniref:Uncharacterized protein n=1 Tax=Limnoglobus roseus TaxID=2598579 RepID=A0A5C1AD30_9BACT|nr:hypothetical protein [Limnoglobus roseus]QEL17201.1 hypothetical protein PX52LOC_04184 [Limnoglobus roseus]